MPLSFLDLPREIRDLIYDFTFISPTGLILMKERRYRDTRKAKSRKSGTSGKKDRPASSSSNPLAKIIAVNNAPKLSVKRYNVHPCALDRIEPFPELKGEDDGFRTATYSMNLSLLRTCSRVYAEASHLFWSKNTFCFASPDHLLAALKGMGQVASRRIQHVWLDAESAAQYISNHIRERDSDWSELRKAVVCLASRRRRGRLESLTIRVSFKLAAILTVFSKVHYRGMEEMDATDGLNKHQEAFFNIWETLLLDMGEGLKKVLAVPPVEKLYNASTFSRDLGKYLIGAEIEIAGRGVYVDGQLLERHPRKYDE